MSKYIDEARAMREKYQTLAEYAPDERALSAPEVYDFWAAGVEYTAGNIRRFGDGLFRCLTGHVAQMNWSPVEAPALWARIADPAVEWPEWIMPTNAENAYKMGAKVSHNGKKWTSNVDANVWEPGGVGVVTWDEVTG